MENKVIAPDQFFLIVFMPTVLTNYFYFSTLDSRLDHIIDRHSKMPKSVASCFVVRFSYEFESKIRNIWDDMDTFPLDGKVYIEEVQLFFSNMSNLNGIYLYFI